MKNTLIFVFSTSIVILLATVAVLIGDARILRMEIKSRASGEQLEERFRNELAKYKTRLLNLTYSDRIWTEPCVLVSATGEDYKWNERWIEGRKVEGVSFIHAAVGSVRSGELMPKWSRIPVLLVAMDVLPKAELLVYTDMDTHLKWPQSCSAAKTKAMTISWKNERGNWVLRSNWFILRANDTSVKHLLHSWYYSAKAGARSDQKQLNLLWTKRKWVWRTIAIAEADIETAHCASYMGRDREKCMVKHLFR